MLPLVLSFAVFDEAHLLQEVQIVDVLMIFIVEDHQLQNLFLMASVEARKWVDLTIEADQSQQMLLRIVKTEITEILEIDFSLIEYVHLQGYQVPEVHLFVHDVGDAIDN